MMGVIILVKMGFWMGDFFSAPERDIVGRLTVLA